MPRSAPPWSDGQDRPPTKPGSFYGDAFAALQHAWSQAASCGLRISPSTRPARTRWTVWVAANDRPGPERLCRYVLRPPFAQERLRLRDDRRVALELKTAWHDGTSELVFEPLEF